MEGFVVLLVSERTRVQSKIMVSNLAAIIEMKVVFSIGYKEYEGPCEKAGLQDIIKFYN